MIMRRCPICGMTQYSADTVTDWICERPGCGTIIGPEYNQDPPPYPTDAPAPQCNQAGIVQAAIKRATIPTTKLVSGTDWDKLAGIMAQLLDSIDDACKEMQCDYTCPRCALYRIKGAAEDLGKLMEVIK